MTTQPDPVSSSYLLRLREGLHLIGWAEDRIASLLPDAIVSDVVDSIEYTELVLVSEDLFNVRFPLELYEEIHTVDDLTTWLARRAPNRMPDE